MKNLSSLKQAAKKARPVVFGVAMAATLIGSNAREARAAGADVFREAPAAAQVEVANLAGPEALERSLAEDPEISEILQEHRFDQSPDFLPSPGEARRIVWNQTANWIVAVDGEGQPVYLPQDFRHLPVETMGSFRERYEHFEDLEVEGESKAEWVKNDETKLLLGNMFEKEGRAKIAVYLRVEKFGYPTAGAEELGVGREQEDDRPGLLEKMLKRQVEDAKSELEWKLERTIDEAVDIDLPGIG